MTEGVAPLANIYFDGKYIKSVHAGSAGCR